MNEAGQGGWLDEFLRPLAKRRRRPTKRRRVRLELERLEDRLAPATTINILHAAFGAGSLDNILASIKHGTISPSDGGNVPGTLSDGALAQVGSVFGLNITAQNSITFNDLQGPLHVTSNPVAFIANKGDITFANPSNTFTLDGLGGGSFFFKASGNLALGNLNAATFDSINLQAGGSLSVGALTAVNGFISVAAGGAVALNGAVTAGTQSGSLFQLTAGGPVVQAAPIQASQLTLDGSASFTLTNAGNAVGVLADAAVNDGFTGGAVDFVDSTALTLGVASDVNIGVVTSSAPISIVAGGPLTVDYNVSAGAAPVNLAVNAPGQTLVLDPNPMATPAISGASVTLIADVMSLSAGPINAGAVLLQPFTPSLGIDLGAGSNGLVLSQADLNTITAGALSIGGAGFAGDITIDGLVSDSSAGWNTLVLVTGGHIDETAGAGFLQVENLALVAGEGIGDDGPLLTIASNLAFDNASGAVDIENTGALTVTDVDGLAASSNGGPTTLAADSPITFAEDVVSAGTLTAATGESSSGNDSPEDDITVLSGVTVESTGGDVVLQAADSVVLPAGSLVQSDTGAVDIAVGVNDADQDGVLQIQGDIVAPNGVNLSPVPSDLKLALSGLATPGALPTTLSGSFTDAATAEPHTVVIAWGDNSPNTVLTLAAGVDTFSSSHVYAAQGNFAATVQVVNASLGSASGGIIVPVLPATFGPIVAVDAQPGQTVTASVVDPDTGAVTSITLVRAPGPGTGGELLAAQLLNAFFPPSPGTVEILAAFDFREFNLNAADQAFVSVTFPAIVPPGTIPIVQYLDPETGQLEFFNPANPPGYLTITIGANSVTVTLILDNTTIPKLTELTGTEFTVSAAVPATAATATVSQSLASSDTATTAPGREAVFQSTSQLTFGLAASQAVQISSTLVTTDAATSGGDAGTPDDPGAAAARAAWAQFVADEFADDPQTVWQYGGDDAIRLWLVRHPRGVAAPPPVRPAPDPTPPPQPAQPHEEARLQAFEFFLLEAVDAAPGSPQAGRPVVAPPAAATKDGRRLRAQPGATTPLATPYVLGAALGGLLLAKPERKRKLKVEGPPEGWRR